MYAHQVIEELQDQIKIYEKGNDAAKMYAISMEQLIGYIKASFKFHVSEYTEVVDVIHKHLDGKKLMFNGANYIKLPYDKCWIDYTPTESDGELNAVGMLVHQHRDNKKYANQLEIMIVVRTKKLIKDRFKWFLLPFIHTINVGAVGENIGTHFILPNMEDIYAEYSADPLAFLETFLKLLNCKNTTYTEVKASHKLNKKRAKNNKLPIYDYHILEVFLKGSNQTKSNNKTDIKQRIHFCRGHFKIYTEENPLFGKYTGMYWWEPHVRGKVKKFLDKDYKVV